MAKQVSIKEMASTLKEMASTLKELKEGVVNLSAALDTLRKMQVKIATGASKHWTLPFWQHSKGSGITEDTVIRILNPHDTTIVVRFRLRENVQFKIDQIPVEKDALILEEELKVSGRSTRIWATPDSLPDSKGWLSVEAESTVYVSGEIVLTDLNSPTSRSYRPLTFYSVYEDESE
jgi:hypothetical protein